MQGTAVVVTTTGAVDQLDQFYDTQSGLLVATRYQVQQATVGLQVTELQLVGR